MAGKHRPDKLKYNHFYEEDAATIEREINAHVFKIIAQCEKARHYRSWTIKDLAQRSGISQVHYCMWKQGIRRPNLGSLYRVLKALDLEFAVVFR